MGKKIILIGCGNIGSRHLQALARIPFDIEVDICEPNKEAQKLAQSRLAEIQNVKGNHNYYWYESIDQITKSSDLSIIATTSVGRVDVIDKLLRSGCKRFLVEKVVCQSKEEYDHLLSIMRKNNAKGWVNTNLRYFKTYQKIHEFFEHDKIIHLSVIASNISALGTNAIHYMDLFSWLVNDYMIKLNGDFLLNELYSNKRGQHLVEFGGTLIGSVKTGSTIVMTFIPDTNLPTVVNIAGTDKHVIFDETNEKAINLMNGKLETLSYRYEHASSLTTEIVQDILEKDNCMLTSLDDSYHLHCELFRVFNAHIKKVTNTESKLCPIT